MSDSQSSSLCGTIVILSLSLSLSCSDTPDVSKLSYEQSKYLGGEVEYTHLVKGLDFVLLEKVRKELDESTPAE